MKTKQNKATKGTAPDQARPEYIHNNNIIVFSGLRVVKVSTQSLSTVFS